MPLLIGTAPNQVPTNGDLGTMAFEDAINYNEKTLPNVIEVNSSSTALRVTQTGTGNALLVEDSANPDSSPFVIDASGNVVVGSTTQRFSANLIDVNTASNSNSGFGVTQWFSTNASGPALTLAKSQGGSVGTNGIVSNGAFSSIYFRFDDGANFLQAASIAAVVDGTPGTNDMPGRLVFSTTADGASSPTERMRIDSAGKITIGAGGSSGLNTSIFNARAITGGTSAAGYYTNAVIQSDVTANVSYFETLAVTTAASFSLTNLRHFMATQGSIGAGSSVASQQGFSASSSLTGATNNYGFHSNIASGTGRYNFYAAGSADNYFAGQFFLGYATANVIDGSTPRLQVNASNTSGSSTAAVCWSSDANSRANLKFAKSNSGTVGVHTAVASGSDLGQVSFSGSDGTNFVSAAAINCEADDTVATNSVPGRITFSTTALGGTSVTERLRIDSSGNVIHTAPTTAPTLSTNGTMVFNLTSNTNLRVSVRGSDGVTRTANITLA